MAVIGIDLGTTYSGAAQFVDGETEIIYMEGRPTLPSVVGIDRRGRVVIGHRAKRNQVVILKVDELEEGEASEEEGAEK